MQADSAPVKGRWATLDSERSQHLERQRRCAALTIPSALPPQDSDSNTPLPTPWQGLGARCTNNLTSKLLLSVFPPNSPFFRFDVDPVILKKLEVELGKEGLETEVTSAMTFAEQCITRFIEQQAFRVPGYQVLRLLIVTGNCLVELPDAGGMKVYRLDSYVTVRDHMGKPIEIIIREHIGTSELPPGFAPAHQAQKSPTTRKVDQHELFTHLRLIGQEWHVKQELFGKTVPGSVGTYKKDDCPWIALTWSLAEGEHYGRGLVEEYLGDFNTYEALSKSIAEASAIAARIVFLLNPNGTTKKKELLKTPNGGVAMGNADDVTALHVDKMQDFQIAYQQAAQIEERISAAFLLNSSVQRNAERVTAEEVRWMAQELEDALGGVYSVLSLEFQLPLVRRIMKQMEAMGTLPPMPEAAEPTIVTGFEALGRGHDAQRLGGFIQALQLLGEEALSWLNMHEIIKRFGNSYSVQMDGLVKDPEEKAQEEAQAQQQAVEAQMVQQATPELTKAMTQQGQPNQ